MADHSTHGLGELWALDVGSEPAVLSITPLSASKAEGNSGATPFTFRVSRSGNTTGASSAGWTVASMGAAGADGADFAGGAFPSGTVSFAAGQLTRTVTVSVVGDRHVEPNESFQITLSNPSLGTSLSPTAFRATGSITNDDPLPVLSVAGASASRLEGHGGSTPFSFVVSRAGNLSDGSSVRWAVSAPPITATTPNPANGADFAGGVLPTGTVTFAANETSRTVTVSVNGDTAVEANEAFRLTLSAPTGAVLNPSASSATGTIVNDDSSLAITPLSASKAEGNGGATPFTFRVSRLGSTTGVSTAVWTVASTGTVGADGADFAGGAYPTGTVSFAAGQLTRTVTVAVAGDREVESNESFQISLSDPSLGTSLHPTFFRATGTILNDDTVLSIAPLVSGKGEGRTGATPFTFTVSRRGNLSGSSTVRWDAAGFRADSGDFDPTNAADFSGPTSGTISFSAGQASRTLTVGIRGDIQQERDETFLVSLSAPTGATLETSPVPGLNFSAPGLVRNDDLIGDATANTLVGSELAEYLDGGANVDILTGGGATDVFGFRFGQSPLTAPDRITDFAFGADKIDLLAANGAALPAPVSFSRAVTNSTASSLESLAAAVFADANGARPGNQGLGANSAVLVQATNAAIAGTYVLVNNGVAGRSSSEDVLIQLSGFTGTLPALGAIAPSTVFL